MKRTKKMTAPLGGFSSGASLGGKVSHYREQTKHLQARCARLHAFLHSRRRGAAQHPNETPTISSHRHPGVGDLFGELCLAGYPLRVSTAVALTASSIRTIQKKNMLQMLRKKNKASNALVAYLLSSVQKYKDHVAELLTSSAEQRLARVLLRLAHLDKTGPPVVEIPILSHQVLAEMVGTTRPRVNLFMNRFRKQGFIDYDGGLEVRQSLRKVLRSR